MPTTTKNIYPAIDGYVGRNAEASWDDAHDATSGEIAQSSAQYYSKALRSSSIPGGRGAGFYIYRCFFTFDTSGFNDTPSSALFRVTGYGTSGASTIYCAKASSDIESAITTADFDSIENWDHDASNSGNLLQYAQRTSSWAIGSNNFTLFPEALVDIAGQDRLNIVLLTALDLLDSGGGFPPPATTNHSGLYFSNHGTLSVRPVIQVAQQNNSVFFGANF